VIAAWSQQLGVAVQAHELPFATVRSMTPEAFVVFLSSALQARAVVVGEDFRFGRDRSGDLPQLARLAEAHGMVLAVVPAVCAFGAPISSSRVRAALAAGDVAQTSACLGRPYRLVGKVVRGDGRGRQLGFPTANCAERENLTPGGGVYAAWATVGEGSDAPVLRAAVNIGRLPSVGEDRPITVEAHFLDHALECYGRRLALDLVARLRDEQRFADLDALRSQIARDVAAARTLLAQP
jgi:riboflavin kinase/FMN adenylyltransferase